MSEQRGPHGSRHAHRSRRRRRAALIAIATALIFIIGYSAMVFWSAETEPLVLETEAGAER
jgi:hypothetical protein